MQRMKNVYVNRLLALIFMGIIFLPAAGQTQATQEQAMQVTQKSIELINYVRKMNYLQQTVDQTLAQLSEGIQLAQQNNNRQMRDVLFNRNNDVFNMALEQLKTLDVPEELKSYHWKIIDVYTFRKLANDALLNNNTDSAKKFYRQGATTHILALEEFKVVLSGHNVPDDVIRGIEQTILKERQSLREAGLLNR